MHGKPVNRLINQSANQLINSSIKRSMRRRKSFTRQQHSSITSISSKRHLSCRRSFSVNFSKIFSPAPPWGAVEEGRRKQCGTNKKRSHAKAAKYKHTTKKYLGESPTRYVAYSITTVLAVCVCDLALLDFSRGVVINSEVYYNNSGSCLIFFYRALQ